MKEKTLGSTLRFLREREKMSIKEVIAELQKYGRDITDKTLYSYENDKRAASADMFLALCQIYRCTNVLETFADFKPDYSIPDDSEWRIIEKYRELDTHGKEMVDFTLEKEWERSKALAEQKGGTIPMPTKEDTPGHLIPRAAHNDYETESGELERMRADLSILKKPN